MDDERTLQPFLHREDLADIGQQLIPEPHAVDNHRLTEFFAHTEGSKESLMLQGQRHLTQRIKPTFSNGHETRIGLMGQSTGYKVLDIGLSLQMPRMELQTVELQLPYGLQAFR